MKMMDETVSRALYEEKEQECLAKEETIQVGECFPPQKKKINRKLIQDIFIQLFSFKRRLL